MLDLSCPNHAHSHIYVDGGREFVIPESFIQRVKDELLDLYRRLDIDPQSEEEEPDVLEDASD